MHKIKHPIITAILDEMLQNKEQARKINNNGGNPTFLPPSFMPFNIDFLYKDSATAQGSYRFAFSHYYKQNGDMIADPDMEVLYFPDTQEIAAMTFQDYRSYQDSMENKTINLKLQRDLTVFLKTWLNNVIEQQDLKPRGRESPPADTSPPPQSSRQPVAP